LSQSEPKGGREKKEEVSDHRRKAVDRDLLDRLAEATKVLGGRERYCKRVS